MGSTIFVVSTLSNEMKKSLRPGHRIVLILGINEEIDGILGKICWQTQRVPRRFDQMLLLTIDIFQNDTFHSANHSYLFGAHIEHHTIDWVQGAILPLSFQA